MQKLICFACDAGMGSSALAASLFKRQTPENWNIIHASLDDNETLEKADAVIVHEGLKERAKKAVPYKLFTIKNFTDRNELSHLIKEIKHMINNKDILSKDSIILNCKPCTSDEAIVAVGNVLKDKGYVEAPYIDGMIRRDHDVSTYIGNDLAIPHGVYDVKDFVNDTGLAVMIYPDGVEWNGSKARIVIGIAAKGDDHMEILSNIALKLCEMDTVNDLVACNNVDHIWDVLTSPLDF